MSYIRICPKETKLFSLLQNTVTTLKGQNQIKSIPKLILSKETMKVGDIIIGTLVTAKNSSKASEVSKESGESEVSKESGASESTSESTSESGASESEVSTETDIVEIPYLHLERKTKVDLLASVTEKKKRYISQNAKLHQVKNAAGYIIEMSAKESQDLQLKNIIKSLQFKHVFLVKTSKSMQDTCDIIIDVASRVVEYQKYKDSLNDEQKMEIDQIPVKVTASKQFETVFIRQLLCTTSLANAQAIQTIYPTMQDLQNAWNTCEKPKEMLIGIPNAKTNRKIGNVTSQAIYDNFFISYKNLL